MTSRHPEPPRAFAALIGDLVASRDNPRRAHVQQVLQDELRALNAALGPAVLAAGFKLTAGDEIQALFHQPSHLVRSIQTITDTLQAGPLRQPIAFGAGFGTLSTGALGADVAPLGADVALLDGPCFHRARTSLERSQQRRSWVAFEGFGEERDRVLDSLFELMGAIRAEWTPTQSRYALDVRTLGQQKKVAQERDVSPSVVSESLKAARFETLLRSEQTAELVLRRFEADEPGAGALAT